MFELALVAALWNGVPVELPAPPVETSGVSLVDGSILLDAGDRTLVIDGSLFTIDVVEGPSHWQAAHMMASSEPSPSFIECMEAAEWMCGVYETMKRVCFVKWGPSECDICCMDAHGNCDHCQQQDPAND